MTYYDHAFPWSYQYTLHAVPLVSMPLVVQELTIVQREKARFVLGPTIHNREDTDYATVEKMENASLRIILTHRPSQSLWRAGLGYVSNASRLSDTLKGTATIT